MANEEIARRFYERLENGDIEGLQEILADDFVFDHQAGPQPMDKQEFLQGNRALFEAIPDLTFNAGDFEDQGDKVRTRVKIVGTHQGELDLSPMGLPAAPATGTRIELPEEDSFVVIEGGKVRRLEVPAVPGGGILGILDQIGVEPEGAAGEEAAE